MIWARSPACASTLKIPVDFLRSGNRLAFVVPPGSSCVARQRTISGLNHLTLVLTGRTRHRRAPLVPFPDGRFSNRWSYSLIRRVRGYTGRVRRPRCGGIPVYLWSGVWGHTGARTVKPARGGRLLAHLVPCEPLRRIAVSTKIVTSPVNESPAARKGILSRDDHSDPESKKATWQGRFFGVTPFQLADRNRAEKIAVNTGVTILSNFLPPVN